MDASTYYNHRPAFKFQHFNADKIKGGLIYTSAHAEKDEDPPAHKHGIESPNTTPSAKVIGYNNSGMIRGNLVQCLETI